MAEWKVPLFDLHLGEEEYRSVKGVLDSKWLTMGKVTNDFESAFADYLGVRHAMTVSSGTAAMHLANYALGLEHGDEVICPSLTFVASANAILYTGATPVFADIGSLDQLTLSPNDIESRVSERVKAIVAVHYAGFPCNMDRIMEIARNYNLFVIEDVAHAVGAEYGGYKLGTIGDIGCFSFFSNKNMTTAEGGMVVTNRDDLAEKIRIARSHGMTSVTWDRYKGDDFSYDVVSPGFNYQIDELRSSLGLVQLKKLDENNRKRRLLWNLYRQKLSSIGEIEVPFSHFSGSSSYHIFPILLSERIDRKHFMGCLREQGIQTSIHFPPIHVLSYYKRLMAQDKHLPLTEHVGRKEVTLPLFPTMQEQDIEYVVNCIKEYMSVHCY